MNRTARRLAVVALSLWIAGCGPKGPQPVIPRAAFLPHVIHRSGWAGRDTSRVTLGYPEFIGARTGEALDSLRAAIPRRLLASYGSGPARANDKSMEGLMTTFLDEWRKQRMASGRFGGWFFDRRITVVGDTLGVVTLRTEESAFMGGAHPSHSVSLTCIDWDHGRTLGFADLFRESARDSLSAALEPAFRRLRGIAPDSTLKSAGFWFDDGRFHVNDNVGVTDAGVTFFFNPYEIAPWAWGVTELVVPADEVRPFANPNGPLAAAPEHGR